MEQQFFEKNTMTAEEDQGGRSEMNIASIHQKDPFRSVRMVHPNILRDFAKIMVHRRGNDRNAFMILENIIGDIAPGVSYRVDAGGLTRVSSDEAVGLTSGASANDDLAYVEFDGEWNGKAKGCADESNILRGNGTLTVREKVIRVPVAATTDKNVASYGATLLKVGDVLRFETREYLPVTVTNIGSTYVDKFLYIEGKGGGPYIEYHDRPHFHMPLEPSTGGYLLLGKVIAGKYRLSAFAIPFGSAIYTGPNVLHADSFLIGRYAIVYSVTDDFSTVLFKDANGGMARLEVVETATRPLRARNDPGDFDHTCARPILRFRV
jgi:hypothetical protein